ncbi:galactose mutarotase [Aplysia californica]|uniref:Galactose mutarotase n=1 Tax=Aplysia californica TaxID=6500 RepID=A0ABM1W266_APLCA|nr:galactose mutarotase [Aplysia californica]
MGFKWVVTWVCPRARHDNPGKFDDIVVAFSIFLFLFTVDYETKSPYFGAICGRVANVVAGAQFDLEGQTYKLYENRPPLSVHGGKAGFDKKTWQAEVVGDNKLSLTYVSPHLEENYPGELTSSVTYSLDDHSALTLQYAATTTRTTVLNLTNHAYFNLAGHGHGHLNDHRLKVFSDKYLVLDDIYVPTGEIQKVDGSPFDFQSPVKVDVSRLQSIQDGLGYFNTFPLENAGQLKLAARMEHAPTGRYLECRTTEPGVSFYTSGYMPQIAGKAGAQYKQFCAFSLEAQHFPDSIHHPNFPTTVLKSGETYTQTTVYTFGVM